MTAAWTLATSVDVMSKSADRLTPVEAEVLRLQIAEKGCEVCALSELLTDGRQLCRAGETFPACRRHGKFRVIDT